MRKEIKSLADLMRIANSFAASDAAMRPIKLSPSGFIQGQQPSGQQQQSAEAGGTNGPNRRERREMQRNNNFNNTTPSNNNNSNTGFNKRKDDQPDTQYGSRQVSVVQQQEEQGAAGGSRRQKPADKPQGRPQQGQIRPPYTMDDMLDAPCKFHSGIGKPANHTTRQCDWTLQLSKGKGGILGPPPPPPPPGPPPPNARQQFPRQDGVYMIFTSKSYGKGSRRAREQGVNATMPTVPQLMSWSDNVIAWGPENHPSVMPNPGSYALVVDAIVAAPLYSCKFTRNLIDGGSVINIMYRDTMVKLDISESELEPSRTVFHGIVPGLSCTPLGRVQLEAVFRSEENFRREPIWFEVADLSSLYHILLGSPAIAKFMM